MTFYRADDPDDELDDDLDLSDFEAPLFISIHHHIPMQFGKLTRDGLMLPDLPPIAPERARKPASPGMSPIFLPAPFDPNSLRLLAPPARPPRAQSCLPRACASARLRGRRSRRSKHNPARCRQRTS